MESQTMSKISQEKDQEDIAKNQTKDFPEKNTAVKEGS